MCKDVGCCIVGYICDSIWTRDNQRADGSETRVVINQTARRPIPKEGKLSLYLYLRKIDIPLGLWYSKWVDSYPQHTHLTCFY